MGENMSDEVRILFICFGVSALPIVWYVFSTIEENKKKQRRAQLEAERKAAIEGRRSEWGDEICDNLVVRRKFWTPQ